MTKRTGGRALGSGRLLKTKRGRGDATWVLDWRGADGVRRRQALSSDKRVAERMRAELVHRRDLQLAGLGSIEGMNLPLTELRDAYLTDLRPRVTKNHFRNVEVRTKRVLTAIRVQRVRDLQTTQLLQMRAARVAAGVGHRTINHEIMNFRAMLNWAEKNGLIGQNPIRAIDPLPMDRGHIRRQRRAMSEDEIQRFLAAAAEDDRRVEAQVAATRTIANGTKGPTWNARERRTRVPQLPLWRGFIETGARYGEFTRTQWGDLDVERCLLTLRGETTKNGKTRVIPLRREYVNELVALRPIHERALWRDVLATDRLFLTPEGSPWDPISNNALRIFRRLLERAEIDRTDARGHVLDLHALRHSAATRWARAGVPITTTQKLLGHSTIELTSKFYVHADTDDMRDAVESVAAAAKKSHLKAVRAEVG